MTLDSKNEYQLNNARNLALQKIGRNIYNFGLIEKWLKYLVSISESSGYVSDMPRSLERKANKAKKLMLGQLIEQILEKMSPTYLGNTEGPTELKEAYFSHCLNLQVEADKYQFVKVGMEAMVEDRNKLIHHFHEYFKLDSIKNCSDAIEYLDSQRDKHISIFELVQGMVSDTQKSIKLYADFIDSDKFLKFIELQTPS